MAVRIYTLAKELKIDSKELVELCTRAGIQDKGSALASMSDDEVAKLKEFIAAKSRPPERPAAPSPVAPKPIVSAKPTAAGTLKREDYIAPAGVARGRPPEQAQVSPPKPAPPAGVEPRPRPAGLRPGGPAVQRSGDAPKPVPRPAFKLAPMPAAGRQPPQTARN